MIQKDSLNRFKTSKKKKKCSKLIYVPNSIDNYEQSEIT